MLILQTLTKGPLHGYAITERIQRGSEEVLRIEEGSMYPALYRMQKRGWIAARMGRSENNRRAKFYSITDEGNRQLKLAARRWLRFNEAVSSIMEKA